MTANGSALLGYAVIISVKKLTQVIKYGRIPKNTETQQENTKQNTKKTTEINWDRSKKISSLVLVKTMRNVIAPHKYILKIGVKTLKHS